MHLRDEFAARAMQALIAQFEVGDSVENVAYVAYRVAESMLQERNRVAQVIDDRGQGLGIIYNFDQPHVVYPGTESEDEQQPDHVQPDSRNGQ